MRRYEILVTTRNGSRSRRVGIYTDGFAAAIAAMEDFPEAMRISARRVA